MALFFGALFVSLILTPLIRLVSLKLNLVDLPSARKIHTLAISRVGGVAIFISFTACIGMAFFIRNAITTEIFDSERFYYLMAGGFLIFMTGLVDDIMNLNATVKLAMQVVAGTIAYFGGLVITVFSFPMVDYISVGSLSYPLTILWFLLIINAVNLIDGLDGLAAGVALLACLILTLSGSLSREFAAAAAFACLSGAILGFLKYNFNPATIFMGDSGSYFIGYMIAGLSLFGSIKSHTAVTIFITLLALGIPLSDTVVAALRRYMLGSKIFSPDKKHFHHQLIQRGFSHRNTVLLLYLITLFLCFSALLIVYLNDHKAALILLIIAVSIIVGISKLGYLNHLDFNRFVQWTFDIQDGLGFSLNRRQFLAHQLAIHESRNLEEFRLRLTQALKQIGIDYFKLELGGKGCHFRKLSDYVWSEPEKVENTEEEGEGTHFNEKLSVSFPLIYESFHFGRLTVSRNNSGASGKSDIVLRRLEILRRTMSRTLFDLKESLHD
jgi:UDP-GlcNAc:undecaprenyl-phosphate GlcNAc-1-phosphate transferase